MLYPDISCCPRRRFTVGERRKGYHDSLVPDTWSQCGDSPVQVMFIASVVFLMHCYGIFGEITSLFTMAQETENVMFCLDTSASMISPFGDEGNRMDAAVSLMDKFADALIRCNIESRCGLVEFSSEVTLSAALSPASDFKAALKDPKRCNGLTSTYPAIILAIEKLLEQRTNNMRIIVITDGCPSNDRWINRIAELLVTEKIRLDVVFLSDHEYTLIALARKTGGIFVMPKTRAEIDDLVGQEAFFKLSRRQFDLFNPAPLEEVVKQIKDDLGLRVAWTRVPEKRW